MRSAVSSFCHLLSWPQWCYSRPLTFRSGMTCREPNEFGRRCFKNGVSNGRTKFDISDPALVPSLLALAAEQSGCRYKEGIEAAPIHFMRIEGRRLAMVFYFGS
jgi:hypothetical protein